MNFLYFYTEIELWSISSSRILEIKDILFEKEPMPQNNGVYCSCYVEHHQNLSNVQQQITTCTHNVLSTGVKENKSNRMLNHTKFISVETFESIHAMLCS